MARPTDEIRTAWGEEAVRLFEASALEDDSLAAFEQGALFEYERAGTNNISAEALAEALCAAMPHDGGGSRLVYEDALEAAQAALSTLQEAKPDPIAAHGRELKEKYGDNVAAGSTKAPSPAPPKEPVESSARDRLLAESRDRAGKEYPVTDGLGSTERSVRLILQEGFVTGYQADREESSFEKRDLAKAFREGAFNMSDRWRTSEPDWPHNPYTESGSFQDD